MIDKSDEISNATLTSFESAFAQSDEKELVNISTENLDMLSVSESNILISVLDRSFNVENEVPKILSISNEENINVN